MLTGTERKILLRRLKISPENLPMLGYKKGSKD